MEALVIMLAVTGLVQTFNLFLAGLLFKNVGELWKELRICQKERCLK